LAYILRALARLGRCGLRERQAAVVRELGDVTVDGPARSRLGHGYASATANRTTRSSRPAPARRSAATRSNTAWPPPAQRCPSLVAKPITAHDDGYDGWSPSKVPNAESRFVGRPVPPEDRAPISPQLRNLAGL